MSGRSAFVAGATGYTGREVVRLLAESGARVVAHVRPDSPRLEEWRERFAAIGASVEVSTTAWEREAMTETLRRIAPDAVFALLGTTKKRAQRAARAGAAKADYESVDYGLTHLLLEAAKASGVRTRFVYLSALGVTPRTRSPYLAPRARIEAELRESGLPFTVVRPSWIVGEDRDESRPGERVGATLTNGVMAVIGALGAKRIRDRYQSISNTELAQALVSLAFDPAADGRVIESEELGKV
jgi:uncharacterized protein YbjT (DUF2867 family)